MKQQAKPLELESKRVGLEESKLRRDWTHEKKDGKGKEGKGRNDK